MVVELGRDHGPEWLLRALFEFCGTAGVVGGLVVSVIAVGVVGWAVVDIVRSHNYPPVGKALWLIAVVSLPLLAGALWFLLGRGANFARPTRYQV